MPLILLGFFALVLLPPALMGGAIYYGARTQNNKDWYLVLLDPRVRSAQAVADAHSQKFGLSVTQVWNHPEAKGYTALIPVKQLERLRDDRRVTAVESRDESPAKAGA